MSETTEITEIIAEARASGDYQRIVELVPYARLLGMSFARGDDDRLLFRLDFKQENVGNHLLPAIHGGVIGAFMEHSALLELVWSGETDVLPKVIDFSIDYLRPGRPETIFAQCEVIRQGQRVANVAVTAWQSNRDRAIATARCHFLLSRQEQH